MWFVYISVACLPGILTPGQALPAFTELKPSDSYEVKLDGSKGTVTFVNPHSDQPVLREIVFYHLTEKAYNGEVKKVISGHYDSDSEGLENQTKMEDQTSRAFTNGHGHYDLEVSEKTRNPNETTPANVDADKIETISSAVYGNNTDLMSSKSNNTPEATNEGKLDETHTKDDIHVAVEDDDAIEEPNQTKIIDEIEEKSVDDLKNRDKRSLKESPLDRFWSILPKIAQKIMSLHPDILDAKKIAQLIYDHIPEPNEANIEKPILEESEGDTSRPESTNKAETAKRLQDIFSSFVRSGLKGKKTYGMSLAGAYGVVWDGKWGGKEPILYEVGVDKSSPNIPNPITEYTNVITENPGIPEINRPEIASSFEEDPDIFVNVNKERVSEHTNVIPEGIDEQKKAEIENNCDKGPGAFVDIEETKAEHQDIESPKKITTDDTRNIAHETIDLEEHKSDELKLENLLSNEQFWTWLGDWMSTYTDLLKSHIREVIKEEVTKLYEIKEDKEIEITAGQNNKVADKQASRIDDDSQTGTKTNDIDIKDKIVNDVDELIKSHNITNSDTLTTNGIKVISLANLEEKNIFIIFTDEEKDAVIQKLTPSAKVDTETSDIVEDRDEIKWNYSQNYSTSKQKEISEQTDSYRFNYDKIETTAKDERNLKNQLMSGKRTNHYDVIEKPLHLETQNDLITATNVSTDKRVEDTPLTSKSLKNEGNKTHEKDSTVKSIEQQKNIEHNTSPDNAQKPVPEGNTKDDDKDTINSQVIEKKQQNPEIPNDPITATNVSIDIRVQEEPLTSKPLINEEIKTLPEKESTVEPIEQQKNLIHNTSSNNAHKPVTEGNTNDDDEDTINSQVVEKTPQNLEIPKDSITATNVSIDIIVQEEPLTSKPLINEEITTTEKKSTVKPIEQEKNIIHNKSRDNNVDEDAIKSSSIINTSIENTEIVLLTKSTTNSLVSANDIASKAANKRIGEQNDSIQKPSEEFQKTERNESKEIDNKKENSKKDTLLRNIEENTTNSSETSTTQGITQSQWTTERIENNNQLENKNEEIRDTQANTSIEEQESKSGPINENTQTEPTQQHEIATEVKTDEQNTQKLKVGNQTTILKDETKKHDSQTIELENKAITLENQDIKNQAATNENKETVLENEAIHVEEIINSTSQHETYRDNLLNIEEQGNKLEGDANNFANNATELEERRTALETKAINIENQTAKLENLTKTLDTETTDKKPSL